MSDFPPFFCGNYYVHAEHAGCHGYPYRPEPPSRTTKPEAPLTGSPLGLRGSSANVWCLSIEQETRIQALEMALKDWSTANSTVVIARAEIFYKYIMEGKSDDSN